MGEDQGPQLGAISRKFSEARAKRARTLKLRGTGDLLAVVIATGLGVGFMPVAPGTFGSLVGVAIFYGLFVTFKSQPSALQGSVLLASLILAAIGIWASNRAEKIFEQKDAGQIVIDEVCGQVISFAFASVSLLDAEYHLGWALLIGFALFRLFDIFKPYPIRRLEALGSGLGVMADDVLAGIYAAVVLSLLLLFVSPPHLA